jgi:hypothetical protein
VGAFPFLGGSFNTRSPSFDAARSINCYIEPSESGTSRSPSMLLGTPGLALWLNLAGGAIRGAIVISPGQALVVAGANLYSLTSSAAPTFIGSISTNLDLVSMAFNGLMVMLVDGPTGYFIDPFALTFTSITDPAYLGGTKVDFADGYFVWNDPNTGKFQITRLYSDDMDALDFATAEGSPDNIVSLIVDHRELWLLGSNSTEVWIDVGDPDFPFQRIQGAFLEIGCVAAQSVAKADNSIFWLSTDARGFGTVQRAVGYAPQRVSNHAVEFAIAQYQRGGDISDAQAYTYSQEGHLFYVLSFPSANGGIGATWVLDISNGLWHERAWRNPSTAALGRHRSNCQMNFAGLTIVGDWETGNLYSMDLDTFTDNGDPLPLIRICPHIAANGNYVFFNELELFMQTGIGLPSGQGADPQAILSWSDDGGYTWSNEVPRSIGKIGERRARVRWLRLGRSRDRIFKVEITDPVRRVFTGCNLTTQAGRS